MRERSLLIFMIVALGIALPAIVAVWRMDHLALHMAMNQYHGPFMDLVFPYITDLASGWLTAALALILLRKSWRAFLMVGLTSISSAVVVQLLKQLIFPQVVRPSAFLEGMPGLSLVAGVELHRYMSFPSGHTTAAFSLCIGLAVVIGRPWPAAILAVVAAILAYSRVYLSQHFTEDILAGALLGSLVGIGVYWALYRGEWAHNSGLDRSPFRRQNQ